MDFSVNSPILFIVVGIIIALVMAQSVFFLLKAIKRSKEKGMDQNVIKKTIISSAVFTIAPAISILVGVIALSVSLGIPLPWLRLSVIGSISYETVAADAALKALGLSTANAITDVSSYITVVWVMTSGIAIGLILVPLITKKIQGGMSKIEQKDHRWREILSSAMFMGMISAFLGYVFCDVSLLWTKNLKEGVTRTSGLIPVVVMVFSAVLMAIVGILVKKFKLKWLENYALPISLVGGMLIAIPVTAWLG